MTSGGRRGSARWYDVPVARSGPRSEWDDARRSTVYRRRAAAAIGLALAATAAGSGAHAATLNEPMTGTTASGWVIGGSAYLTASTGVDTPGDGWLRLTSPANDQAGYAYYNAAFDVTAGAIIQFDYATWGGSGADGYSIFLFDGSQAFSVGASGGSLGYAQKTVAPLNPGMAYGYIGLGVDEYGNFSSATEGRIGGPGLRVNSVALRGPYNHPSGAYYYLGGSATLGTALSFNGQAFRPQPTGTQYRKVLMYLQPVAAPNYLRIDVYVQFGYNQPYTAVITNLNVARPIPAQVKIGYAASTGGSTNYHEIRNLVINPLPSEVDLMMFKTAASSTATLGGTVTYTVTARNYGPSQTTVSNVPITDVVPAQLTSVTWTCATSGGSTCGAASGSGNNISTTATLPFNSAAIYTITGTVDPATPLGTALVNTATLTVPGGTTDYIPANNSASTTVTVTGANTTISGVVYNDADHDNVRDVGEGSSNEAGIYAKLFRASDLSTPLSTVAVTQATGAYSFTGVPTYGTYTVILSSNNAATYTPSFPDAEWIYTSDDGYVVPTVTVTNTAVANVDLGVYRGSRFDGKVIKDDGSNGAATNPNDGVLNASETGLAGVTLTLRNNANTTTYDTDTTNANGEFTLFTSTASATLRIYQTNLAGYVSVSSGAGTTGGTYNLAGDYLAVAYTLYADYSGVIFGDVPDYTFTPTPQAQSGNATAFVYYAHTFTPGTGGSVAFTTQSRSQGGWPALVYYLDVACNGTYQVTDTVISGAIATTAGTDVCILVRDSIPSSATNGTTDAIVTRATFTYTNSVGPITSSKDVTDTTTVQAADLSTSTKTWVDLNGGDQDPGDTIQYTITLTNTSPVAASGVTVTDDMPPAVDNFSVVSFPGGATNGSTSGGGANGTGYLSISNVTVAGSGSATIVVNVRIAAGTAAGTAIDNSATITNPAGPGAQADAPTITVSASAIGGAGMKALYVHGSTLSLSRTRPTTSTYSVVPTGSTNVTWSLTPVLQSAVTLSTAVGTTIPVVLWARRDAGNSNSRDVRVRVQCGAGGTVYTQTQTLAVSTTITQYTFALPIATNETCAAGQAFRLQVAVTNGGGSSMRIYSANAGVTAYSVVNLPSASVINVDSVALYTAAYPAATTFTASGISPSVVVRVRAVVSDPFGSFDISSATLRVTDPGGAVQLAAGAMTEVDDTGAATSTWEYAYTVPTAGLTGNWTVRVTANEGAEGTISDFRQLNMPVTRPVLTMVKSRDVATAAPGTTVTYTLLVTNTGAGDATAVTLTDTPSRFLGWRLASFVFTDGSPASTLTLGTPAYSNNNGTTWVYAPASGAGGAPAGYDNDVTNWRIIMNGTMPPGSSFTLRYQMRIK